MYCTNCGTQIDDDAKFCTSCGKSTGVTQAAPIQQEIRQQAPPPPIQQQEPATQLQQNTAQFQSQPDMDQIPQQSLHAVAVPVEIKTGILKSEPYIFLFAQTQTIVIYIGKDQYRSIIEGSHQDEGFLKKAIGRMSAFRDYAENLGMQSLQSVMNLHPGSLIIDNNHIQKLRIRQDYDPDDSSSSTDFRFELRTGTEKYKGTLDRAVNVRHIRRPLKNIFGRRVKI